MWISIREHSHAKLIFLFFAQSENFKCVAKRSFLRDFGIGARVMDLSVNVLRPRRSSLAARYLPSFVSISNYIREKVSGLAWKGWGTSLIWIWGVEYLRLSLVSSSFSRHMPWQPTLRRFPNTFSGDRTVSDLSLALISRLSDAQSNIRASFRYCIRRVKPSFRKDI